MGASRDGGLGTWPGMGWPAHTAGVAGGYGSPRGSRRMLRRGGQKSLSHSEQNRDQLGHGGSRAGGGRATRRREGACGGLDCPPHSHRHQSWGLDQEPHELPPGPWVLSFLAFSGTGSFLRAFWALESGISTMVWVPTEARDMMEFDIPSQDTGSSWAAGDRR